MLIGAFAGPVAKRWAARIAAATLTFWCLGILLVLIIHPRTGRCPVTDKAAHALRLPRTGCVTLPQGPLGLTLLGFAAVSVVAGSGLLVAAATPRLLTVLTGAGWPLAHRRHSPTRWLWVRLLRGQLRRRRSAAVVDPVLLPHVPPAVASAAAAAGTPAAVSAAGHRQALVATALAGFDGATAWARLRRWPSDPGLLAPTRIGNIYAAVGERVTVRHGLDLAVCWEPLLTVFPPAALSALTKEALRVSARAQNLLWSVLGAGWAVLLPAPLAAVWVAGAAALAGTLWVGLREACETHADVIEALVTAQRGELYRLVGIEPPLSTALEPAAGQAITAYLAGWGGLDAPLDLARGTGPEPAPPGAAVS